MKNILILGAGRSSSSLINYLLEHAEREDWIITVADISMENALMKTGKHPRARAVVLDAMNAEERARLIEGKDIVISMLPASLHQIVAMECLQKGVHLATASYVSPEMKKLDEAVKARGLVFMNEIGLDPGIDHMSAMEVIHRLKKKGCRLLAFRSYCGGLVAPESDTNPWGYKFSWNPRNVILAGQGTARFRENGRIRFLPYSRLFSSAKSVQVPDFGKFDAYANRDSLSYLPQYGIEDVQDILRGTLRADGFCKAWDALVQLGLTDDSWQLPEGKYKYWDDLLSSFVPAGKGTLRYRTAKFLHTTPSVLKKLDWLGIFGKTATKLKRGTPAQYLQALLERKWKLGAHDKDMVVMYHEFHYSYRGKKYQLTSSLVLKGKNPVQTAMAQTVGIPLAISAGMILKGQIRQRGVLIPVTEEIYRPILKELATLGIRFIEKEKIQKAR
ncbi:MAG: saccharopine dehydrogenase NADP-binding domain-containing protein [Bacteroidia bacterium]|nr:saccharopine dehydrogenase NADP-binding domain-containing protein [Bacteroidia bacterium]